MQTMPTICIAGAAHAGEIPGSFSKLQRAMQTAIEFNDFTCKQGCRLLTPEADSPPPYYTSVHHAVPPGVSTLADVKGIMADCSRRWKLEQIALALAEQVRLRFCVAHSSQLTARSS